jgi:mortality factor 4-like protein 1
MTSSSSQASMPASPTSPMHIEESGSDDSDLSDYGTPPPFQLHQKVLCRDANNEKHYYESKIVKMKCLGQNMFEFYVHYFGWSSRWDRWATKEEIVDDTEENRKIYLKAKEQKKRKKDSETSSSTPTRRKKNFSDAAASRTIAAYQEYCDLPFTLKTITIDECDKITRKGFDSPYGYDCEPSPLPARSVHVLPATVTVHQVLRHYQRKRGGSDADQQKQEQVRKFCEGFSLVFDGALPVCLLYPEERPQYDSMMQDDAFKDKPPSEIYGCEFLLRLMVRLPTLLLAEPKNRMAVNGPLIADLIVLLQKNRQACFKGRYREPKYTELLEWEKALADSVRSADKSKMDSCA